MSSTIVPEALQSGKSITREHGEYRAAFDGNTIGYFDTRREAEMALDEHVYDLLSRGLLGPAETTTDPEPEPARTFSAERSENLLHLVIRDERGNTSAVYRNGGQPAGERRIAQLLAAGYVQASPSGDDDGTETEPYDTEGDEYAAQVALAERIARAHQLGSGPAVWWERIPVEFDIDAAGARADHLVPMLLSWRAA